MKLLFNKQEFSRQLESELVENILLFWMTKVVDKENGGFYGAVTNDLKILNNVPRFSILCSRILWTFSKAYIELKKEEYLNIAQQAFEYLSKIFWDEKFGGVYWSVNSQGKVCLDKKHSYAQAFAVYSFTEYFKAAGDKESLSFAKSTFEYLEKYAYDKTYKGYLESSNREWHYLEDMRLSLKDMNCSKSMNTNLHVLEAYSNLVEVWKDNKIITRHKELLETFMEKIFDDKNNHLKLFFDRDWKSLSENASFGHDIEASWLLIEAAQIHNDKELLKRTRNVSVILAESTLDGAVDSDGGIFFEGNHTRLVDGGKEWWVQAEAIVGFYNAYQITGDSRFANAAYQCWNFIQEKVIDKKNGDWYKRLTKEGIPVQERYKAGPWECPYHHSRLCFEMKHRLN